MISRALRAQAPVVIIGGMGPVGGPVPFVPVAEAVAAGRFAAAVVVGDDVILAVARVFAGADPGYCRHLRPRRATVDGAAAAGAQVAVNGAVAPVFAGRRVSRIDSRRAGLFRVRGAGNRQQGHDRTAGDHPTQSTEKTPAGRRPGYVS